MPFIVRRPGTVPAGVVNSNSVVCGVDLYPTLCSFAGVSLPPEHIPDGQDMSQAFLGLPAARTKPVYWFFLNDNAPTGDERSPRLAVRSSE